MSPPRRLSALLRDLRAQGLKVKSVAIVGAPDRNLAAIGSPHIRAHAAEGVLFRRVWQVAAQAVDLPSMAFSERGSRPSLQPACVWMSMPCARGSRSSGRPLAAHGGRMKRRRRCSVAVSRVAVERFSLYIAR